MTTRNDKSIYYSQSTFITCIYCTLLTYLILDLFFFKKAISVFNGLLYCKLYTLTFIFFIYNITGIITLLTSFYPKKVIFDIPYKEDLNYAFKLNEIRLDKSNEEDLDHAFKPSKVILDIHNKQNIDHGFKPYLDDIKTKINYEEILEQKSEHYNILEYSLIILFVILGGITLLSSNDFITIFLSIELQSYGLYLLATIYRNSETSTTAGLTYFLLGGLSSCIILLGQSLLYINLGNTNLDGLYIICNIFTSDPKIMNFFFIEQDFVNSLAISNFYQYFIQLSIVIFSVGFLFKISSAPFHSWSPGVYDHIPTVTTTFVAIIAKISILILLMEIIYYTSYTTLNFSWTNALLFSSFLSLIIGSVLGLTQFRIKRLYAYSTISHIGFLLLGLCINSMESTQAFFFYLFQYSLSNLNAFVILLSIGYTYKMFTEKPKEKKITNTYKSASNIEIDKKTLSNNKYIKENNLSPIEYIDQIKGYFHKYPLLAVSFSITLYSFIGIPPLVGFFAKQMILSSALDNGYVFMTLIAIGTSVISAVYYLYIIKHLFFEKTEYVLNDKFQSTTSHETKHKIVLSSSLTCIISILTCIIVLFLFIYTEIYSLLTILTMMF